MIEDLYDVIVAGAGPAGCACAIILKQAGLKVCLVDHVTGVTFKAGESLPGAAIRLLNRLGIRGIEDLLLVEEFKPCVANVSSWGSEDWVYQDALRNPEGGGWHLNRCKFDQALLERAKSLGVEHHHGKITQLESIASTIETGNNHSLTFSAENNSYTKKSQSKWVVDATGRRSAISKKLGITKTSLDDQMAALCWLQANRIDTDNTTRIKSVADGWWYTARLPDGNRVLVFCGTPNLIVEMVRQPHMFFEQINDIDLLPYPVSQNNLQGKLKETEAGISKLERIGGKHWIAIGDAALSFDPLSSQGIFFALYSGIRGAETIVACEKNTINNNDEIAIELDRYQQQVNTVFQANQKSRQYYYSIELRFSDNTYWQQRVDRFIKVETN